MMYLIKEKKFNGYPVVTNYGPLIQKILIANEMLMASFFSSHNDIVVMFFILKFPKNYTGCTEIVSKFFDSFRFKINYDLIKKTESRGRKIYTDIGYIWVKELSASGGWHYHVAIFLNRNVYNCFGVIGSPNPNMYNRIKASWASAMGCSVNDASGLVEILERPVHKLKRDSVTFNNDFENVMRRLSYFAKLKTKPYGGSRRIRFYGTSKR